MPLGRMVYDRKLWRQSAISFNNVRNKSRFNFLQKMFEKTTFFLFAAHIRENKLECLPWAKYF
jgi:hypothetical protein